MSETDPIALLKQLVQCPSVTPEEGGALALLERVLIKLGFRVERIVFSHDGEDDVENLYARIGTSEPHLMFAGHTDVVPTGDASDWQADPFSGEIIDGEMYGRGAVDMKGGIACFIAAFAQYVQEHGTQKGSVSFLITGDEEGPAVNGTEKLLRHAAEQGEVWDGCIVGEPTNPNQLGDMVKIGRRGSMSARVTVQGKQGHAAYPHLADNPLRGATTLMHSLFYPPLDEGTDQFPPTNLEITSIDTGNKALNVIPQSCVFQFNIRFNDIWNKDTLSEEIRTRLQNASKDQTLRMDREAVSYDLEFINRVSPVFLTKDDNLIDKMSDAVAKIVGKKPALSTTGGTSDARFIKDFCPVIEFGLVGQTMHMIDERAKVDDVHNLTQIYKEFLINWFS